MQRAHFDLLICDMIKFFDIKEFDTDVVDIQVVPKQPWESQMLQYIGGNCSNEISLKFHHDPLYSGFNHYEPIVNIKMREDEDEEYSHPDIYDVEDDKENDQQGMMLDDMFPDIGHGKPFPTYLFSTTKPVEVQYIPPNIGGFKMYKINTNDKDG